MPPGNKIRVEIPRAVAAKVQFESDRTCCVCRRAGKKLQIHHIDEDPSNNDPRNLAVLCLECHGDTQIRGGFGRKLDSEQVTLYRDDWVQLVTQTRAQQVKRTAASLPSESERVLYITTLVENLRQQGQYALIAGIYNGIGNDTLRDRYVELALAESPSDVVVCHLRGLQGRPDLIPDEVSRRLLERQERAADWSQRARALMSLDRPVEAAHNYVKGILKSLDEGRPFGAAFYLKEAVEKGVIDALFEQALQEAADNDDLWWQARALQELGWNSELKAMLLENADRIENSDEKLLPLLREAQGRMEEARHLRTNVSVIRPGGEPPGDRPIDDAGAEDPPAATAPVDFA